MSCPKRIHEASTLGFNSALDIFSVPPTNVSVTRSYNVELLPLSAIDQGSPIMFRLFNDNLWTDMSRVYLHLELGIEKKTSPGDPWRPLEAADTLISSIQYLGQTFIQQLKVQIGNVDVYDSGQLYPYKTYFTNELSYPTDVKSTYLAAAGYRKTLNHDVAGDDGFTARCQLFEEGKRAQFLSRLDFDLGNQELYLLNNIESLITIYRAQDSFLLQNLSTVVPVATQLRLFLHHAKLYVKMVDVQPSLNMNIYSQLKKQTAKYSLRRTELRSTFLTAGRKEIDHNVFSASIPRRLTIGLVSSKAFNGNIKLSPFKFQPYNIRELSVHAAGQIFPAVPYSFNFDTQHFMRGYIDLYEALGQANSDRSCGITLQQFASGWTIFVISLTSTLDDSCGFELLRSGTTSVHLKFNSALPEGVEMIVMGEFDQMLMIDYNRRVMLDSNIG